jgi:hypothetical protein
MHNPDGERAEQAFKIRVEQAKRQEDTPCGATALGNFSLSKFENRGTKGSRCEWLTSSSLLAANFADILKLGSLIPFITLCRIVHRAQSVRSMQLCNGYSLLGDPSGKR